MTSLTVQLPVPLSSSVDGAQLTAWPFGSVTVHETVPVGVPSAPDTVAVKLKLPPVATPAALSLTVVPVVSLAMEAEVSWPELVS